MNFLNPGGDNKTIYMQCKNKRIENKLFAYFFGIYIKFGYNNPSILTPLDSVDVAI